jgi:hypothetical protein
MAGFLKISWISFLKRHTDAIMENNEQKLAVLKRIGKALNQKRVRWGLGGSLLLYFEGIASTFHDIDILIAEKDLSKALIALRFLGKAENPNPQEGFHTKHFIEYNFEGVEIDLIAGFVIVHNGKDYYLPLRQREIAEYALLEGTKIPLMSVRAWERYYDLMGRKDKVALINAAKAKKPRPTSRHFNL